MTTRELEEPRTRESEKGAQMCARELSVRDWKRDGTDTRGDFRGRVDELPGAALGEEGGRQLGMQGVAAAMHDRVRDNWMPDEREIADQVQDLVPHELVFVAQ